MVEEHELCKEKIQEDYNDRYWEQRYTVVQRHIPSFLQKMAGKVLSTGELHSRPWSRGACARNLPEFRCYFKENGFLLPALVTAGCPHQLGVLPLPHASAAPQVGVAPQAPHLRHQPQGQGLQY